ncbi:hypothetical protein [[Clostridium] fimetarium]|uniref:Fluoroquinolone transport system permease protein n=1 Tax=[Clostridium] fimetarium TaxID=99656 RepID=A0A1I0QMS9_9FIRM|nr:hypothetical protein [[Clostridium] fimetarium]SEW28439.1 fluoroquinolone transport system permease protein [[Clostridium] fimetarium]
MRLKNMTLGDINFQRKYGFYYIYFILIVFYGFIIYILPSDWRKPATAIMIYSDPAAMGMFFMGAIVLLEKSENVLNSIAISPVKTEEYILSKIISLGIISVITALILGAIAGLTNYFEIAISVFLCSSFFTLLGLLVASKVSSLNQFTIATVPFEIICFLPPIIAMFWFDSCLFTIHPGTACINLIIQTGNIYLNIGVILIWFLLLWKIVVKSVKKMINSVGGIKL